MIGAKMAHNRTAEQANYWQTTVHPAKSQTEIIELLENFGTSNMIISQGRANDQPAWMIRFEWRAAVYRFTFVPLHCHDPLKESSFGGKRRKHSDQAYYQMGRIAVNFIKAVLTAAETNPDALFGFVELPGAATHQGDLPMTAAELGIERLTATLPPIKFPSLLRSQNPQK